MIAGIAGAVCGLALPPVNLVPFLFLGIPILLRLIDQSAGILAAARLGWFFGFGLNLVGLYWITEAILLEAARFWWFVPMAVPALAAIMAAFIGITAAAVRMARPGLPRILVLAGVWVIMDLARQFVGTGFPWNPLGSAWEFPGIAGDVFIQPAAWVGVHGLTASTLLMCSAPSIKRGGWAFAALSLVLWAGLGAYRLTQVQPIAGADRDVQVNLVQGNIPQGLKWDQARRLAIFNRYLDLSRAATSKAPTAMLQIVVWPETASPFLIAEDVAARDAIASAVNGAWSIVGSIRYDSDGQPRNSLFVLKPDGAIAAFYDKWHLVPFGEYQPSWLPVGVQVVPGGGLKPGAGPQLVKVGRLPPFSPLICYEAIFSAQATPSVDRPSFMVNITNDAWFGNSAGPRQHLAAARMRAVEEGIPLLRAANTGISAVFDGRGHEIGRLDLGSTGVLSERLPKPVPATAYSKFGLLLPGALSVSLVGAGFALSARVKPRARNSGC